MAVVTELGYMGIGVSDVAAWKDYATRIIGMELVDEGEGDRFYLRMDLWHHRFVVHANGDDDVSYVGWRVAHPRAFDEIGRALEDAGIEFRVASAAEAKERRVLGLMKLTDPGGVATEIFYSPELTAHRPFHPGRPLFGKFVTGGHGMGHVMFREMDLDAAMRFYGVLGFDGATEYLQKLPDGKMMPSVFMHCNDRQHSLAFIAGGPKRLLHFEFEYQTLEDLGQTYDAYRDNGLDLCTSLGMHSNDRALTFYAPTPSGWLIEPGWNGRVPPQQEHHHSDVFGHDLINGRYVGNIQFRPVEK